MQKNRRWRLGNSGASMMFVLAAMLLLLSVCVSVIAAAGTNAAAGAKQQSAAQTDLYIDSFNKVMIQALTASGDAEKIIGGATPITLSGLILNAISYPPGESGMTQTFQTVSSLTLNMGTELDSVFSDDISLSLDLMVTIKGKVCYEAEVPGTDYWVDAAGNIVSEDEGVTQVSIPGKPEVPWEPKTASVSGTMAMFFTTEVEGSRCLSVTTYQLTGVYLEEPDGDRTSSNAQLKIKIPGEWEVSSYDRADLSALPA